MNHFNLNRGSAALSNIRGSESEERQCSSSLEAVDLKKSTKASSAEDDEANFIVSATTKNNHAKKTTKGVNF